MMRGVLRGRVPRCRSDRGAAAVEFALILPILMVLVCGIINYGDMLSVRQSVSQAAAEGARAAAVDQGGSDAAKQASALSAVNEALGAQNQTCAPGGCTATIGACAGDATKRCATVEVTIDYDGIIPGFGLVLPEDLEYTAVARVS